MAYAEQISMSTTGRLNDNNKHDKTLSYNCGSVWLSIGQKLMAKTGARYKITYPIIVVTSDFLQSELEIPPNPRLSTEFLSSSGVGGYSGL